MSEIDAFQESQFQNQDKKGFKNSSLETGSFIPEFGDHVWKFRSNEIDAVNALGHFKNQQISTDRFQQKWKLRLEKENIWDVVIQEKMDIEEVYRNMLTNDAVRCERV
jgi:hypothetical protein